MGSGCLAACYQSLCPPPPCWIPIQVSPRPSRVYNANTTSSRPHRWWSDSLQELEWRSHQLLHGWLAYHLSWIKAKECIFCHFLITSVACVQSPGLKLWNPLGCFLSSLLIIPCVFRYNCKRRYPPYPLSFPFHCVFPPYSQERVLHAQQILTGTVPIWVTVQVSPIRDLALLRGTFFPSHQSLIVFFVSTPWEENNPHILSTPGRGKSKLPPPTWYLEKWTNLQTHFSLQGLKLVWIGLKPVALISLKVIKHKAHLLHNENKCPLHGGTAWQPAPEPLAVVSPTQERQLKAWAISSVAGGLKWYTSTRKSFLNACIDIFIITCKVKIIVNSLPLHMVALAKALLLKR